MYPRIFVIDDCEDIQILIRKTLESDFIVESFLSPKEAIDSVESNPPDLILMDIDMPKISGHEALTEIKSIPSLQKIPIIMVSSKTGHNTRTLSYQLGAIHYLEKPFHPAELRALIKSLLKNISHNEEKKMVLGGVEFYQNKNSIHYKGQYISLTSTEYKILSTLSRRHEKILSREELINEIHLYDNSVNDRSIDAHIARIRKKINKTPLSIKSIYGQGYLLTILTNQKSES